MTFTLVPRVHLKSHTSAGEGVLASGYGARRSGGCGTRITHADKRGFWGGRRIGRLTSSALRAERPIAGNCTA